MIERGQKKVLKKAYLLCVAIFALSLSFEPDWSSKALITVIFLSLINTRINKALLKAPTFYVVLLILGYTLFNSLVFNVKLTVETLSVPICLSVLYYVFVLNNRLDKKDYRIVLYSFSTGVILVGVVNVVVYFISVGSSIEFYEAWNKITTFDIHKIYYAAFVNMMVAIVWHYSFIEPKLNRVIFTIALGFSWLMLYFTGAKSSMLINVILLTLFLIQKVWAKNAKTITSALALLPIALILAMSSPIVQGYFIKLDGEASRIRNYTINQKLILDNPFFGYGVGNEFETMQNNRSENSWEFKNEYNAHNQYFHILLGGGLVLFVLYFLLFSYVDNGSSNQSLLPSYFVLIVAYVCLIESFFERHHGTFFITFFISLFIGWNEKYKKHDAQGSID